jgi:hypothetical protein
MEEEKEPKKQGKFFEHTKIDTGKTFDCPCHGTIKIKGDMNILKDKRGGRSGKSKN